MSEKAGIADPTSKSLGVAILDYDGDGWPDIFVANDTTPNQLYRNNRNGTFTEEGVAAGVAYSEDGVARGAMGVDAGDYDRSGRPHLLVGNFSNQMLALYHNEGGKLFVDQAPSSAVGRSSLLYLAFGVFFIDYDLDGHLDIFAANGHIEEAITKVQPKVQYKEPPLMFRNAGNGTFEHVSGSLGPAFAVAEVARGAAYADYDHDGDLDILDLEQSRSGAAAPERGRQPQSLDLDQDRRCEVESDGHRGDRPRAERVGQAVEHGPERVELRVAERSGPDLRCWGRTRSCRRSTWSGRAA